MELISGVLFIMNINYLKEFLTLAETKNYWNASEILFMNESTLSKHIKKLEAELQVPLFTRNTRKVELSLYGECLIPYAQNIIANETMFQEHLKELINTETDSLVLGVIPSMVQYHLTDILVDLKKKYSKKNINIIEGDTLELQEALLHKKCSLAFLRDSDFTPIDDTVFEKISYTTDELCVILPANHPKAGKDSLSMAELASEDFVTLNNDSLLHQIFTNLCKQSGFTPNIVIQCKRMDSIFDLVAQNMGISILTDKHFDDSFHGNKNNLKMIPLIPSVHSNTYLCYLKDSHLNVTAHQLIEYIRNYKY